MQEGLQASKNMVQLGSGGTGVLQVVKRLVTPRTPDRADPEISDFASQTTAGSTRATRALLGWPAWNGKRGAGRLPTSLARYFEVSQESKAASIRQLHCKLALAD